MFSFWPQGRRRPLVFVINQEKSIWCSVQSIVWLYIVWNFEHGTIAITDVRIGKIEERLSLILQKKLVFTRELASVTGSVISLSPVFGNLSRMMSRQCQISIAVFSRLGFCFGT